MLMRSWTVHDGQVDWLVLSLIVKRITWRVLVLIPSSILPSVLNWQNLSLVSLLMVLLVAIPALVAMKIWLARESLKSLSIFNIVILLP
jgi:hypothetical protein